MWYLFQPKHTFTTHRWQQQQQQQQYIYIHIACSDIKWNVKYVTMLECKINRMVVIFTDFNKYIKQFSIWVQWYEQYTDGQTLTYLYSILMNMNNQHILPILKTICIRII